MAIDTSPKNLLREVEVGERKRDERLATLTDQIARYHGPWYKGEGPVDDTVTDPENHGYEFMSSFVGQMVGGKPRVRVETRRPTAQQQVAGALQAAVNRWIQDTKFETVIEKAAYDYMFRWSALLVTVEPRKDQYDLNDPLLMPQISRLSPRDMGWDAMAPDPEHARLMWHRWTIDHDDLIAMAEEDAKLPEEDQVGWNLKTIKNLVPGREMSQLDQEFADRVEDNPDRLERNEISLIDVWIADDQVDENKGPDQGFNGSITTIAQGEVQLGGEGQDEQAHQVLPRRDYFGPKSGPYVVTGCYIVPDQGEPLSPLVAVEHQANLLNSVSNSAIRSMLAYKKGTVVAGVEEDDAQRLNDAEKDHLVLLETQVDLNNQMASYELGGVSQQQFVTMSYFRTLLERVSGFTDVQRGNIQGEGTATEVNAALDASASRTAYIREKFVRGMTNALAKVMHFFYYTEQIIFPLGQEGLDSAKKGTTEDLPEGAEAWFFGGIHQEGSGGSIEDLSMSIDLMSFMRTSEASLKRKSETVVTALQLLPVLTQPGVKGQETLKLLADLENMPELLNIFDFNELGTGPPSPDAMVASQAGVLGASAPGWGQKARSGTAAPADQTQDAAAALGAPGGTQGSAI